MLQDDEYCSGQSVSSCNSPMVIRGPDSLVIKKWILVLLVLALLLSFSMLIVISVQHYQVLAKVAQIHRHNNSGNFEISVSIHLCPVDQKSMFKVWRWAYFECFQSGNVKVNPESTGIGTRGHVPPYRFGQNLVKTKTQDGIDEEVTASLNVDICQQFKESNILKSEEVETLCVNFNAEDELPKKW